MRHPARYSDALLPILARAVDGYDLVLDPFAGTGEQLAKVLPRFVGIEIEPEWAACTPNIQQGNALALPFGDGHFDAVVTSPCYGNRFADHHNARDTSRRRSYTHDLRHSTGDPERELHPDNAGTLPFGPAYQAFHERAWAEVFRVLAWGGRFVLNVKDHYKTVAGEQRRQHVTAWHASWLRSHGFTLKQHVRVPCPGLRHGQNHEARIAYESVLIFDVEG